MKHGSHEWVTSHIARRVDKSFTTHVIYVPILNCAYVSRSTTQMHLDSWYLYILHIIYVMIYNMCRDAASQRCDETHMHLDALHIGPCRSRHMHLDKYKISKYKISKSQNRHKIERFMCANIHWRTRSRSYSCSCSIRTCSCSVHNTGGHGVASVGRIDKIIGLFCKRVL